MKAPRRYSFDWNLEKAGVVCFYKSSLGDNIAAAIEFGMRASRFTLVAVTVAYVGLPDFAYAQRTSENPLAAAKDAFGTTIGNESIGLYSNSDVRGFSPVQAGNLRIEGLYFDSQAGLSKRIVAGSAINVGISAQSYAFPAPTGVADFRLRQPGDTSVASFVVTAGPYDSFGAEVDAQVPVIQEKLSLGFGIGTSTVRGWWDGTTDRSSYGAIARWRPTEAIEIIPFWAKEYTFVNDGAPYMSMSDPVVPPEINRRTFFGQKWANFEFHDTNFGVVSRALVLDKWLVQVGAFRSVADKPVQHFNLYLNILRDGVGDNFVVGYPPSAARSLSGELRVSRDFEVGPVHHSVQLALRARDAKRSFGGTDTRFIGRFKIGVPHEEAKPDFLFGAKSRSVTQQQTVGLSYAAELREFGRLNLGLQKTFYERQLDNGNGVATTKAKPWLVNVSVLAPLDSRIAAYGGFTQGLEETGEAPTNAINRGEAVPSSKTRQFETGVRYRIAPGLTMVAGAFQIEKPFYNPDASRLYRRLGDVRHRGIEASLSGQIFSDLTLVAGVVLLQARIETPELNAVSTVPLGRYPRIARMNLEYRIPAVSGLSVDMQTENVSSRSASSNGIARMPARTSLALGARYRFKVMGSAASLRVQALNLTNEFGWNLQQSGLFDTSFEPRRIVATLAVDY